MKKALYFFLPLLCLTCLFSCVETEGDSFVQQEGLRPVYAAGTEWRTIETLPSREIQELGKIYYKDGLLFVNERNAGIHILDNNTPTAPIFLKFISIPGSKDIAIKGDYLYTDNVTDLVVLDISDFDNIQEVNRIENIYPQTNQEFPEFYSGFFECVNPELGTVIGWELAILNTPQCRI